MLKKGITHSNLFANSISVLNTQILIFVCTFVVNILIARNFGPEGKGIYSIIVLSGLLLYAFSNLGLTNSFIYHVAKDRSRINETASFAALIGCILGIVYAFLFTILYQYTKNTFLNGMNDLHMLLIAFSLPFYLISIYLNNILLAKGDINAYNYSRLVNPLAILVFLCIGLTLHRSLYLLIIPWFAANIVGFIFVLWLFRSNFILRLRVNIAEKGHFFSYGIKGYIADLVNFFTYRLDFFLVNYFIDSRFVGFYSISVALAEILWYLPNSIQTVLMPHVASISHEEAIKIVPQICRLTFYSTLLLSVLLIIVSIKAIPLIYGKEFSESILPLIFIMPGILSLSLSKVLWGYLMGRGKPIYATYTSLIAFFTIICLDIILIPTYKINGAAIASSISYFISSGVAVFFFLRESKLPISELLILKRNDLSVFQKLYKKLIK